MLHTQECGQPCDDYSQLFINEPIWHTASVLWFFWRELHSGTQVAPGQPGLCVSQLSGPQCLHSEVLRSGPCLGCPSALGLQLSTPSRSPSSSPYTMVHEEAADFCLGLLSSETVPPTRTDSPNSRPVSFHSGKMGY